MQKVKIVFFDIKPKGKAYIGFDGTSNNGYKLNLYLYDSKVVEKQKEYCI